MQNKDHGGTGLTAVDRVSGVQEIARLKDQDGAALLPADPLASPTTTEALPNMVSGDASKGDIDVRFDPPDERNFSAIDEIVASDAQVHLERMNTGQWSLIIETKTQRACFMINGKDVARSPVTTQVFWIDRFVSGNQATPEHAVATGRSAAQESHSHSSRAAALEQELAAITEQCASAERELNAAWQRTAALVEALRGLKRYDLITNYRCGSSIEEMEPSDDGDWVCYEQIDALLTQDPDDRR